MPTIEFIYTFNADQEQVIAEYPFEKDVVKNKVALKKFAVSKLNKEEADSILKISCCVYWDKKKGEKNPRLPKWYHACNGKLWFEENRIGDYD